MLLVHRNLRPATGTAVLGFAARVMLSVISNEVIPESHRDGQALAGTTGVLVGFVLMMVLDAALG